MLVLGIWLILVIGGFLVAMSCPDKWSDFLKKDKWRWHYMNSYTKSKDWHFKSELWYVSRFDGHTSIYNCIHENEKIANEEYVYINAVSNNWIRLKVGVDVYLTEKEGLESIISKDQENIDFIQKRIDRCKARLEEINGTL
jgi:hypothetical protein